MARRKWTLETISQVMDGENPFTQVGYTSKTKKRKIGEEWIDSKGITWRQLDNNTRVTVNKQADSIRKLMKRLCSICGQDMNFSNDKLDNKVFPKTGKCYNCLESEEMFYRVTGKWDSYEKLKILKNKRGALKDFRENVIESIDFLKNDSGKMGLVMENGEIITWTGKSNNQWLVDAEKDLIKVNEALEKINKEIIEFESEVNK